MSEADLPIDEETPLRPNTPYGASKVAASYLALQAWLGSGLETIRVRPFNHTGPGQLPNFLVPALAQRIVEAERAARDEIVVGNLDPVRDVNDVRDIVRAYRLLATEGAPGEVYNICSGTGVSVAEIADLLIARAERPVHLVQDPALVRPVETPRLVGDASKLRAATGWKPEYTLSQTLTDVLRRGPLRNAERLTTTAPLRHHELRLAVEPAEKGRDGAGIVAETVGTVGHDAQLDRCARRLVEQTRVVDGDDVVVGAVDEEPRARRDVAGRVDDVEVGDRTDPACRIGRVVGIAQHARAAGVLEEPHRIIDPSAEGRGRREGREPADTRCRARRRRLRACRRGGSRSTTHR